MKRIWSIFISVGLVSIVAMSAAAQDVAPSGSIKGGLLNGKATNLPKPPYPAEAKTAGIDGTVAVDVEVDESGTVVSAVAMQVRKSNVSASASEAEIAAGEAALRQASETAALGARFAPTVLNGVPVRVSGKIVYNFVSGTAPAGNAKFVSGGVLNGKAVSMPMPVYPPAAKAVRASGTVSVQVTVSETGEVIAASAVSGHPLLRAASVEAARQATFAPTMLSGQPVKVTGLLIYQFVAPSEDSN